MNALQQEGAHGQHAKTGRQGTDRTDGGHAERIQAEQHGRDKAQDPSNSGHAPGVPGRPSAETLLRELASALAGLATRDPASAVTGVREMIKFAPSILTDAQADLMRRLAAQWTGTPDAFAKRYGYTRQRLHQMGVRWRSR